MLASVIPCEEKHTDIRLTTLPVRYGGRAKAQELKMGLMFPLNFVLTAGSKATYQ